MAASLEFEWTENPVPNGQRLVLEATKQVSVGVTFVARSAYKKLLVLGVGEEPVAVCLTEYVALYGPLVAGTKIFWRIRYVAAATGQPSAWLYSSSVVI